MKSQLNLSRILLANSVFCMTAGLIFALAARPLAGFLNADPLLMLILGIALIPYGVWVTYNATRPTITRRFTFFIILADSAWVLLNILLLILPGFDFSTDARWAIGITAVCVDAFATLQFLAWRKMS